MVSLDKELNCNRIVNKSHSAAYAVISVRTAWLKYYHPVVFWTETLNSVINKADKIRKYLYCAQKHGITILPPSVNHSKSRFSYEDHAIRIGLSALRDLGKASTPILEERNNGRFVDFKEFVWRCRPGKKVLTSLAYSGGFDEFGISRKCIVANAEDKVISDYLNDLTKHDSWADFDILNQRYAELVQLNLDPHEEYPKQEKLLNEYNYAGMYVSEHPLDEHIAAIDVIDPDFITDLIYEADETENVSFRSLERKSKVVGIVKNIETKITRKGEPMLVGTIEDKTGDIRFTVFSGTLEDATFNKHLLEDNNIVVLDGIRKVNDFGSQIIVNAVNTVSHFKDQFSKIYCLTDLDNYMNLVSIARTCQPGHLTVVVCVEIKKNVKKGLLIDNDSDNLFTLQQRGVDDVRNLRVSFDGYLKLKEASKMVKVS